MSGPNLAQGVPATPQTPLTLPGGGVNPAWYIFFLQLWNRTGGNNASLSPLLDMISSTPGAIISRGESVWQGVNPGAEFQVLRMGAEIPEWDFLDGNSFGEQGQSTFFAAPPAGNGIPSFRAIASADLDPIAGQFPGTKTADNAAAGDVGEYISSQVASGSAIALTSGATTDITSIELTAGDWDVWGNFVSQPAAGTLQSNILAWATTASVTNPNPPNNGCYAQLGVAIPAGFQQTLPLGMMRVTVPNGTTQQIFLSANVTFAGGTLSGYGFLGARRAR